MAERIKYNLNRSVQIKDTKLKKHSISHVPFTSIKNAKKTDNLRPGRTVKVKLSK